MRSCKDRLSELILFLAIGILLCLTPTIGTADDRPKTYLHENLDFMQVQRYENASRQNNGLYNDPDAHHNLCIWNWRWRTLMTADDLERFIEDLI